VRSLPAWLQAEVAQILLDLRLDPYPPESAPLSREYADMRKVRVDGWRILYKVFDRDGVVRILAIKPRDRDTYRSIL
jgi:mRNA-degrading endonuclease RelE of RelBE toxin-antitoxin system